MKNIKECFDNTRSISDMINEGRIDEGLKDWFNNVKLKFKQAWQYLRGVISKFGTYFVPVDNEGNILGAITPPTAGQAFKEGLINKDSTFITLDREASKIVGFKTKLNDVLKLYGSGNSLKYWSVLESEINDEDIINEVKLQSEDPEAKYSRICDNKELINEITMHIEHPELARLLIWGAPGIGKTAIVLAVVDAIKKTKPNYNVIFKTLSNETPDNFTLPKYITVDGQEMATDVPKTWLPVYKPTGDKAKDAKLDENCGEGLLFIDELSRATPQVLNVVLPLVNEGVFNGYKLGSGWTIVCASNRAEDELSGQTSIGNALANRFDQVFYEPTVNSWMDWAKTQNYISPLLLQWLSMPESETMSGGKYFYMDPNEGMEDASPTTLMCTPRSWTNAMRKLAVYANTASLEGFKIADIPNRIIQRALNSSGIPSQAIDSFVAFLEVIRSIGDFDKMVYDVWKRGSGKAINKNQLNKVALPLAQLICTAHSKELPTSQEFTNYAKWLVTQNSDQLASYSLDVFQETFVGDVNKNLRGAFFYLGKKIKANGADHESLVIYKNAFSPVLSKWGISFEEMPDYDYSEGLKILIGAYGDAFKSAVVGDHKDALG